MIKAKIGDGPFLYYSGGKIVIDCSLDRILSYYMQGDNVLEDTEIFAYGFKKDKDDKLQYINSEDLKKRFEEMEEDDIYEIIMPEKDGEKTYQVPSYCGFDEVLYYDEEGYDYSVNCKPIKEIIREEIQKRIKKSDSLRK